MRSTRSTRLALAAMVALGGCGSGAGGSGSGETLTAATSRGLNYTLNISGSGKAQCTTTDVRASLAGGGRTVHSSSHSCGPPIPGGHPLLIQAHSSRESLVVDVPVTGCGAVRGGSNHGALRPLRSRCTEHKPQYRVTTIPAGAQLVLVGIPGAPVINFARHRCRIICISALG